MRSTNASMTAGSISSPSSLRAWIADCSSSFTATSSLMTHILILAAAVRHGSPATIPPRRVAHRRP
jgi:hypothetical protein